MLRTLLPVLCLSVGALWAQSGPSTPSWVPVLQSLSAPVNVEARLVPTAAGFEIEFRNQGPRAVHFEFYLPGSQTARASERNRRIHLNPGRSTGVLAFDAPDHGAAGAVNAVKVLHVRVGSDSGPFWLD